MNTCCKNIGTNGIKFCNKPAKHWYLHEDNICSYCEGHNYVCGTKIDPIVLAHKMMNNEASEEEIHNLLKGKDKKAFRDCVRYECYLHQYILFADNSDQHKYKVKRC